MQRPVPIRQQFAPVGIDALEIDLLEHALDQVLLGREVAIEQGLGDAEPLGKFASLAGEADLREEAHRRVEDLLFPLRSGKAPAWLRPLYAPRLRGDRTGLGAR